MYAGYVDDQRNTDNAWMETIAVNYHDDSGQYVQQLKLSAGDDAGKVKWMDVGAEMNLFVSHKSIVKIVVERLNGHW